MWSNKITKAKGTKKAPWHWDENHQKAFGVVHTNVGQKHVKGNIFTSSDQPDITYIFTLLFT